MAMASSSKRKVIHVLALTIYCLIVTSEGFDSFWMVQQWPPNVCSNRTSPCTNPGLRAFTIHGFWPQLNGASVTNCPGSPFDVTKLASIRSQLDNAWPDVISGNNQGFWAHEWRTHGTCSESQYDQATYFQMALNIRHNQNYDILGILRAGGVTPNGQSKARQRVKSAIASRTGKQPGVRCNTNAQTKNVQLFEVVICFDQDGVTLRDCTRDRCPASFIW